MADLKSLYIDLIGSLYPYEEIPETDTLSINEMLYNLIEISKNNFDLSIEENIKDFNRVNTLIDVFRCINFWSEIFKPRKDFETWKI